MYVYPFIYLNTQARHICPLTITLAYTHTCTQYTQASTCAHIQMSKY